MENTPTLHAPRRARWIFVIGLFLVVIALSVSVALARNGKSFWRDTQAPSATVELRSDGFYPAKLQVPKGATVLFLNKQDKSFWPASDPHPVHDIYASFDSKRPIPPSDSWTFTFLEEGTVKYHDHLSPLSKGTIIVGGDNSISSVTDKQTCLQLAQENQQRICWQFLFENMLKNEGLEASFAVFRELAQLQPTRCHQYAHDLGEAVFDAHARGISVQIGQEAAYCGYGFWHGFTAKMMKESSFDEAKKFCTSMTSSTSELTKAVRDNCAHGIGIGLIPDPPQPEFWGKSQLLISPALYQCDTIEEKGSMVDNCHSGVFHAIVDYMLTKQYGFRFNSDNPLALCLAQEERYQAQCYYQVAAKLVALTNKDLAQVLKLLRQISDAYTFQHTFTLAIMNFVNQDMSNEDYLNFLEECQNLDPAISHFCITGIVRSLFATGTPGKEYLRGIELCGSERLDDQGRWQCFEDVVKLSHINYPQDGVRNVCSAIARVYRAMCE